MPAPSNDNFANAIALNGDSGTLQWYNNIGATAETGEPPNQGATVWFSWSPSSQFPLGAVFFDTREPDPQFIPPGDTPYLNTTLQVFLLENGNGVGALVEVSYLFAGKSGYPSGGFSRGSYDIVQASLAGGQPFYIRVDGVPTGWFQLSWGPSGGLPALGKCGNCTEGFGLKTKCVTTFKGTDFTTGDLKFEPDGGETAEERLYAVVRQSITIPAGSYMLRYCSGYYDFTALSLSIPGGNFSTVYGTMLVSAVLAYLTTNNVAAGLTLSPTNLSAGDPNLAIGDFAGTTYFDGTQFQGGILNNLSNYIVNGSVVTGSALTPPGIIGFATPTAVRFGENADVGTAEDQYYLATGQNCAVFTFQHSGGELQWVFVADFFALAILGDIFVGVGNVANHYNISTAPYLAEWESANGPISQLIGASGVPTYQLLQILPDISLIAVANISNPGNPTGNGVKNFLLSVKVHNNSVVGWGNVTFTPNGFFTAQDSTWYPGTPEVFTLQPSADNGQFQVDWNMTNSVGTFTLALSDAVGNPYPTFPITVTPAFNGTIPAGRNNISATTQSGQHVQISGFNPKITNIGNGVTLNLVWTITCTDNHGNTVQLATDFSQTQITDFSNSLVRNTGVGGTDQFNVYVPYVAGRQLIFTYTLVDAPNTFPPIILDASTP